MSTYLLSVILLERIYSNNIYMILNSYNSKLFLSRHSIWYNIIDSYLHVASNPNDYTQTFICCFKRRRIVTKFNENWLRQTPFCYGYIFLRIKMQLPISQQMQANITHKRAANIKGCPLLYGYIRMLPPCYCLKKSKLLPKRSNTSVLYLLGLKRLGAG